MKSFKYILFNKPYGVLSQFTSEPGVKNLSQFKLPEGVYAAGRLDKDSEGLLLLTNDGPFVETLLSHHLRCYWVQVENVPTEKAIASLQDGVVISSGKTLPATAKLIVPPNISIRDPDIRKRKDIPTAWIHICLKEGKNRQVRKMTAAVGHPTLRLVRCSIGKASLLNFDLQPGAWIEVSKHQVV